MPNWCSNTLTISGDKATIQALIQRAESGDHSYVGPFSQHREEMEWGTFTPIQMEALMQDDDLFMDKSEHKSAFSFHAFVPVPREVMLAPYDCGQFAKRKAEFPEWFDRFPGLMAGYDWEIAHWGCKWGASNPMIESQSGDGKWGSSSGNDDESYTVMYSFDTPWGPPTEFMHSLAKVYPGLYFTLRFSEPGMGFEGEYEWEGGECIGMHDQEIENEEEEEEEYNDYILCPACQNSCLPEEIKDGKCPNCPE